MTRSSLLVALGTLALLGCGGTSPPANEGGGGPPPSPPTVVTSSPTAAPSATALATANDKHPEPPAPPPPQGSEAGNNVQSAGVDDTSLLGQLEPAQVQKVLESNGKALDTCSRADKSGAYAGKIELKLTIGPSGRANSIEVRKSSPKSPAVESCLTDAFKKIEFPKPKNGKAQIIRFPLDFEATEVKR